MKRWATLLIGLACIAHAPAGLIDFSADERARIAAHGPWPPPPALDPGNAWAGKADAIALGEALFFESRLSADGRLSCATCHEPALAFADSRPRSQGRERLDRNAPTLWNAVHERWYGWDGAADSLWAQSLRPLLDPRELASNATRLRQVIEGDSELACRWRRGFGPGALPADEELLVLASKAVGAFVGSLVSARTPFDRFRDALVRGQQRQAASYPLAAQRGLRLFVGRARCHLCHGGSRFSNGEFADIGVPFFVRPGVVDPGRREGIEVLQRSPYNLLSRWADAAGDASVKTRHVQAQHRNFGEFKVPSLRNVAETAPYMHDGQLATLEAVVQHYSELDADRLHADGERILEALHLTPDEQRDLVAFLRTLSDPAARRWQRPRRPACG